MGRKIAVSVTAVVSLALIAAAAFAQGNQPDDISQRPRMRKHARLRERIEMMKMWKLTEALDLDQATAEKVFPIMHDYDLQQRKLRERRWEIIREMRAETDKEQADPEVLRQLIKDFKQNEIGMVELRNKRIDALSDVLSEEQIAGMIILVPQFEEHVKELLYKVRARREQGRWSKDGRGQWPDCPLGNDPSERGPANCPLATQPAPAD